MIQPIIDAVEKEISGMIVDFRSNGQEVRIPISKNQAEYLARCVTRAVACGILSAAHSPNGYAVRENCLLILQDLTKLFTCGR